MLTRIDSVAERKRASEGLFLEECCLCLSDEGHRASVVKCVLSVIMSESFLLSLHLGALTLGIAKTSINREDIDEDLELVHSIVEILVVTFVVSIYSNFVTLMVHFKLNF